MMILLSLKDYLSKNDNIRYTRCIHPYTKSNLSLVSLFITPNSKIPKSQTMLQTPRLGVAGFSNHLNNFPSSTCQTPQDLLEAFEEDPSTKTIECSRSHHTPTPEIYPIPSTLLRPSSLIPSRRPAFSKKKGEKSQHVPPNQSTTLFHRQHKTRSQVKDP